MDATAYTAATVRRVARSLEPNPNTPFNKGRFNERWAAAAGATNKTRRKKVLAELIEVGAVIAVDAEHILVAEAKSEGENAPSPIVLRAFLFLTGGTNNTTNNANNAELQRLLSASRRIYRACAPRVAGLTDQPQMLLRFAPSTMAVAARALKLPRGGFDLSRLASQVPLLEQLTLTLQPPPAPAPAPADVAQKQQQQQQQTKSTATTAAAHVALLRPLSRTLRRLTVSAPASAAAELPAAVAAALPCLEELSLDAFPEAQVDGGACFEPLGRARLPRLTSLRVTRFALRNTLRPFFEAAAKTLVSVELGTVFQQAASFIDGLELCGAAMRQLRLTGMVFTAHGLARMLGTMAQLEVLSLSQSSVEVRGDPVVVGFNGFNETLTRHPTLCELDLSDFFITARPGATQQKDGDDADADASETESAASPRPPPRHPFAFIRTLPSLQRLSLNSCRDIVSDFRFLVDADDTDDNDIASKLTSLSISFLDKVPAAEFDTLRELNLSALEELNVSKTHIGGGGANFERVLRSMPKLRHLNVMFTPLLSKDDLDQAGECLAKLERLLIDKKEERMSEDLRRKCRGVVML